MHQLKLFLENHGFHQEAGTISSVGDAITCAHVKSLKQATLFDYNMTPNPTGYEIFVLQCHCILIESQECTTMNK